MDIPMAGAPPKPDPSRPALDPELKNELDTLVQENDMVLFMKGTPEQPQCGFSMRAAQVLQKTEKEFQAVNVLAQEDPLTFIRALAQWADFPTLPQVWVKGELIGGSDIALDLYESGQLQTMLEGE